MVKILWRNQNESQISLAYLTKLKKDYSESFQRANICYHNKKKFCEIYKQPKFPEIVPFYSKD